MFVGAGSSRQQMLRDGLADLYLSIHLRKVGLLEFDAVHPVEELGYAQSIEHLREWIEAGGLREPGRR